MTAASRAAFALAGGALVYSAAGFVSGCGGPGVGCFPAPLVSQEVLDHGVYLATIDRETGEVWASSKFALDRASSMPVVVQEDIRQAVAEIDDSEVTLHVEPYELRRSTLRVSARKYGVNDGETAKRVLDEILIELEAR